jgi:GT2 family glycosyltransferase
VKYFLDYCLYSVRKALGNIEGEIFVVDNNSTDGSKFFFQGKYQEVKFIWNSENEGFAKANNKALKFTSGDYVLFLNPDTIIPEDCLEKCISFIKSKNDTIACGIKMYDGSGKFLKESKRAFPTPLTSLYKIIGLAGLFPKSRVFSRYHLGYLDENINHEIDVMAGAFMMIPKKILETVGAFDEIFFMYGEDIDLSYRIQNSGYKNFYFAEGSIIHFKGESTRKGSLNYVKMFYKAMSVFVSKHYGETSAGLFGFFIQVAIFLRAVLAASARFLKWIGMPVIDAVTILTSFYIIKLLWNNYIKQHVNYMSNLLIIAFPAFTILFLAASYFSGLYDNGYKQSRLNRSAATAILILLAAYSLLPESLRFSRGILFFGSLTAFLLMTLERVLFLHWKIISGAGLRDEISQTVIAGTENEFNEVMSLLQKAGTAERILGRISPGEKPEPNTIGTFSDLPSVFQRYPIKEIILCEGILSFKSIIESLRNLPLKMKTKIFIPGKNALIGSGSRIENQGINFLERPYNLSQPVSRRNKRLADVIISSFFLISFPVHIIRKKNPIHFFRNVLSVLLFKKTWVGYALEEKELPLIKPGVVTTTGLPAFLNTLDEENLYNADLIYARNFKLINDIKIIWLNYRLII